MQFVRFETLRRRRSWGWLDRNDPGTVVEPLGATAARDFIDILAHQPADAAGLSGAGDEIRHPVGSLRLLPPVAAPSKIIAVGRNYQAHAAESGSAVPTEPMLFGILPSALCGANEDIVLPPQSAKVDWEGELAVVIGRSARQVKRKDALAHVAGYMVMNDVSARDLQRRDGQWTRAKSFDGFKPCGPWLSSAADIGLARDLRITVRVNGTTMQDSTTAMMVFPVDELIEFISAFCTLMPGDIIATGTPDGVGFGQTHERYLSPGDMVEAEIEGLGRLTNRFVVPAEAANGGEGGHGFD